ncbi:Tex family protein [Methylobacterium haplocladii]|uniref:Small ribosomal subunit protein bS1 n=1 Tax=Methylobacterium haplocladii TaxID=1176176 RepID=A0A512IPF4_9HYPH|nr:Tex family protein [Methylobacterium haplocladii]GEO99591.1 RNA-binding protein [Methylobacterium haplocladii]GJD85882.1 Protein YhgF [Methylobacterium haplocladii]GLS58567.1 RNA-binding protein [Methylobacterium haplocladii]
MTSVTQLIAEELGVREAQVAAAVELLDGGSTVPFIARYRKEATGLLDDTQLRNLEERLGYLRDLQKRRDAVIESIRAQGKLTPELATALARADTKARLEDIYLPYKPRRRSKAQTAREAGLAPLADSLLARPEIDPCKIAEEFVSIAKGIDTVEAALEGAKAILTERFAEDADLVGRLREDFWKSGAAVSTVKKGKAAEGAKFSDYFDWSERLERMPSHRILALFRGETEGILDIDLAAEGEDSAFGTPGPYELAICRRHGIAARGRPGDGWLLEVVRSAWRTKLRAGVKSDLRTRLFEKAETEAVKVFAGNLKDLLLAAPAGGRATMGLDPGYRNGVKVAVVDATGKVVAVETTYPHEPQRRWNDTVATLGKLCRQHKVEMLAIGNGTASRETDRLATEILTANPDLKMAKVMVSEAGASVYSASEIASRELPDLDVSHRGAVSIARRLQDPLAELVKIDPKSIGVGQYQHDISEQKLSRSLSAVVEDAVNAVGVDVNTASPSLLSQVSGLGTSVAANIVAHRDANGPFRSRTAIKSVAGLGPKAFELSAGFLRIQGGKDPLDSSGVHPEAYPVVRRILEATKSDIRALIGNAAALKSLQPAAFADARFGIPTVRDIISELEKPGRDPRPAFKTASFQEGVEKITDLKPGMQLEGVVTNVAAFGAFVDIGVHQDGLVHISAMSTKRIAAASEVVKAGDVVRVLVLSIDVPRKRIGLSMRLDDPIDRSTPRPGNPRPDPRHMESKPAAQHEPGGALADALRRAASQSGRRN